MPRDSSGNYVLPSGNPVVTNTNIESTWANNTLGDLADEMQDSLSRSGRGGMVAELLLSDGATSAPGLGFSSEPNTGIFRSAPGQMTFGLSGTPVFQLDLLESAISCSEFRIDASIVNNPQVAIAAARLSATGAFLGTNFGITSVTRTSTGVFEITLDEPADAFDDITAVASAFLGVEVCITACQAYANDVVTVSLTTNSGSFVNTDFTVVVFNAGRV